ncbi:MAG: beta-galactosidase trimerization domain-containing protein [Thermoproteota archaeon]
MEKEFLPYEELPEWAKTGRYRYARLDGGPAEISKAFLSNWGWPFFLPKFVYTLANVYSDVTIGFLKKIHVNWIWVTFSNGFSIEAEEIQREILKPFIKKCHENGIRVTAYMSLTNMFQHNMFRDVPQSKKWVQIGPDGEIVTYAPFLYGGQFSRYLACLNNPEWIDYLLKRVDLAIDAGVDAIFYDNVGNNCTCPRCEEGFRQYSEQVMSRPLPVPKEGLKMDADLAKTLKGEENARRVINYLFHIYQLKVIKEAFRKILDYGRRRKPELILYCNCHQKPHVSDFCNAIFSEDGEEPGIFQGKLVNNAGLFKYLYAYGDGWKPVKVEFGQHWSYYAPGLKEEDREVVLSARSQKRMMAEAAMFQGSAVLEITERTGLLYLGMFFHEKWALNFMEDIGKYNEFLEQNQEYYIDTKSMAEVAVVIDEPEKSQLISWLFASGLQVDAIIDRAITRANLNKYRVIILPDIQRMSDEAAESLRSYVKTGGNSIAFNETSMFDEKYLPRDGFALTDLFGVKRPSDALGKTTTKYGSGTSIYYPNCLVEGPYRLGPYQYGKLNEGIYQSLLHDIYDLAGEPLVKVDGSSNIILNVLGRLNNEQVLIHILNYSDEPCSNLQIKLKGMQKWKVRLISPDEDGNILSDVKDGKEWKAITIKKLDLYSLVVVEP